MRIIDSPQPASFAADLHDYLIDSDASLSFEVKKGSQIILQENYSPDGAWAIRTHKLGKLCAHALWGQWPSGDEFIQAKLVDNFTFLIDGKAHTTSMVIASRQKVGYTPVRNQGFTIATTRITRVGSPEWLTVLLADGEKVTAYATDSEGSVHQVVLYTHTGPQAAVTVNVSAARIIGVAKINELLGYQVCGILFKLDKTQYLAMSHFRFMNNFEVPEAITATGPMIVKAAQKSENAFMYGVERKFRLTVTDEYTVNSGTIFSQADYKIWHDFISARQTQALLNDQWVDIIITKSKFERNFYKNVLKSVEFSFRLADPDEIF